MTDRKSSPAPTTEGSASGNANATRPSTTRRRPATARPETADSYDGPLQEFYPEGGDFEEEDYDDGESVTGVFAFTRPDTSAPPHMANYDDAASDHDKGAVSPTVKPFDGQLDGQLSVEPVLEYGDRRQSIETTHTNFSRGTKASKLSAVDEAGQQDVGGRAVERVYDPSDPPPFSGTQNLNNSVFAKGKRKQRDAFTSQHSTSPGQTLFQRIQRRRLATASSVPSDGELGDSREALTSSSGPRMPDVSSPAAGVSIVTPSITRSDRPPGTAQTSGLNSESGITASATSRWSSDFSRSRRRDSIGLTELTGDPTVADGHTTWGDGQGRVLPEACIRSEWEIEDEDSPYPEVRASVSNLDDPELPALTLRAWLLGIITVSIASAANTFFHFRYPAPYITAFLILVAIYPVGKLLAYSIPYAVWTLPRWLGGFTVDLNPGPFTIKEHTLIVMMANVGLSPAYTLMATVSSEVFYKHDFGTGFMILFALSVQVMGLSFAGMCRRFVVYPASMIWPSVVAATTNLNTLHAEDDVVEGGLNRVRLLLIVIGASFAYQFLPGFLFTALSYFSFLCWIAPKQRVVNSLFGVSTGLGMSVLTFDWNQIAWIGNPTYVPWWASMNVTFGFILFYWIVVPIIYFTNTWYTAYLPVSISSAYDRFGDSYDIFKVITPDLRFNQTAYEEYSPLYISATFNMTNMLSFAMVTCVLVHTALWHGKRVYRSIVNAKYDPDDIHMKLMRHYVEVPDWWYLLLFLVCFAFGIIAIEVFDTGLPVWGYLVSIAIPFIYYLPAAFILAMTSQTIAINVIAELIPGYIYPGRAIEGMLSKSFTVGVISEGLTYVQDLKLGHYMKIPPRATFIAQLSAIVISTLVQVGTKEILFHSVPDICSSTQKDLLTCQNTRVFFTASVLWGLIGPAKMFSARGLYNPQLYALLVGALIPIPLWLWVRKFPNSKLRNISTPLVFSGGTWIPPATGINYAAYAVFAFITQYWARRHRFEWWSKYNYVLGAALDVGTATGVVFIFLTLGLSGASLVWWGNTVYQNTSDYTAEGASYLTAPADGFGRKTW